MGGSPVAFLMTSLVAVSKVEEGTLTSTILNTPKVPYEGDIVTMEGVDVGLFKEEVGLIGDNMGILPIKTG